MNNFNTDIVKKVKNIYIFLFFVGFLLILSCVRWQIIKASDFRELAKSRLSSDEINSLRGTIYANDGSPLAFSEPRFDMHIWLNDLILYEDREMQTRQEFIDKVAREIGKTSEELEDTIKQYTEEYNSKWILLAKNLSSDQWRNISNLKTDKDPNRLLKGFKFTPTSTRVYPEGRLASHIIGLTTQYKNQISGIAGIEQSWDGDLNPTEGLVIKEKDVLGQAVATSLVPTIEPKQGSSIHTTIDKKLQKIIEEKAKEGKEKFEAKSATIIVMDPKTGEIMALANYPDYNPNLREEKDPNVYGNLAVSAPYEVGSIGKVITMAAVIDKGLLTPDSIVLPEGHPGYIKISDDPILGTRYTWDQKPQPAMPISRCFTLSDNVCFIKISDYLEDEDFYHYLTAFGVGSPTGVDLTVGESIGEFNNVEDWGAGDKESFSYGHSYLVNAFQTLSAVSVIPNRGYRMKPHVVNKVVKADGEVVDMRPEPLNGGEPVVSEQTAETVAAMMHDIYLNDIKDYETWYQDLKNYHIGMKSGTALIANQFGYTSDINATQVGFDLSPERKFIMIVRLEEPKVGALSFYNSRVLWLDTFAAIKDYLQVPRKD
jgi:cell division protein FtsI/penicillin-binding protein 2